MAKRNILKEDAATQVAAVQQQLLAAEKDKLTHQKAMDELDLRINNFKLQLSKLQGQLDSTMLTSMGQLQHTEQNQQTTQTTDKTPVKESILENESHILSKVNSYIQRYGTHRSNEPITVKQLIDILRDVINESFIKENYLVHDEDDSYELTQCKNKLYKNENLLKELAIMFYNNHPNDSELFDNILKRNDINPLIFRQQISKKLDSRFYNTNESYKDILLEANEDEEESVIDFDEQDEDAETVFYVEIDDDDNSFIGKIYKDDEDSRWKEKVIEGKSETFGTKTYMSYLTKKDIISWLSDDYDEAHEIDEDELDDKLSNPVEDEENKKEIEEPEIEESFKLHKIPKLDE
jgi:hypothetical protein